jgi:hypothetical protein
VYLVVNFSDMLYRLLFLMTIQFCVLRLNAQDFPVCTYKYFQNKKVSTKVCYDKDNRWGRASAYDRTGKEIYSKEVRRVAGHASVLFSYYPDGAVSVAEYSSAPDAGIQWYRSTTWFSQDGKITREESHSNDDLERVSVPVEFRKQDEQKVVQQTPPPAQNPAACAVIYETVLMVINRSGGNCVAKAKGRTPNDLGNELQMAPGDTMKWGSYILAQQFDNPLDHFELSARRGKVSLRVLPLMHLMRQESQSKRVYFFEVRK